MASVRLEVYRGEDLDLPDVCMRCGAPATVRKRRQFSWYPSWVYLLLLLGLLGLLVFVLVALMVTKRQWVSVPLCAAHKNHWRWRTSVLLGSFALFVALGFVTYGVMDAASRRGAADFSQWFCVGTVVFLLLWVLLAAELQLTSIRATKVTDHSVHLTGVSEEFVRAWELGGDVRPDLDEAARQHWQPHGRRPAEEKDDRYRGPDDGTRLAPSEDVQPGPP